MERGIIVKEYFELQGYLNRANKLSNQKTEIKFILEQGELFEYRAYAVSFGAHEVHKLAVAERTRAKMWERTGNTRFLNLEEFCAHFLNDMEKDMKFPFSPSFLQDSLLILWSDKLTEKFSMLLLNQNYKP